MAEKFGAEEGNEQLGAADLFPELTIPGGAAEEEATTAEKADTATAEQPAESESQAAETPAEEPRAVAQVDAADDDEETSLLSMLLVARRINT